MYPIWYINTSVSDGPGLWNWIFATRDQCEKWFEHKLKRLFFYFAKFLMNFQYSTAPPPSAHSTLKIIKKQQKMNKSLVWLKEGNFQNPHFDNHTDHHKTIWHILYPDILLLYSLWPNSPSPLTDDWKVKDTSSVNFLDVFFFIFCYNLAKNEEKHIMEI